MTIDDTFYFLVLIVSLTLGTVFRRVTKWRMFLSGLTGFLLATFMCTYDIWYSLATLLGFIFIMGVCGPRVIHIVSVIWCFGCLFFFRTAHWHGFSVSSPYANAVQLILTLRLIGVSFEMYDSSKSNDEMKNVAHSSSEDATRILLFHKYKSVDVTPWRAACYGYCFIGLFTGPYYTYRTFQDFANCCSRDSPTSSEQLLQHLQEAPFYGVVYLIASHFYTVDYVRTPEFFERSFVYRLVYMAIVFAIFRMRIYFAWRMSECVCMASDLGAYPAVSEPIAGGGPTNLKALDRWMTRDKHASNASKSGASGVHNSTTTSSHNSAGSRTPSELAALSAEYNFNTVKNLSVWGCEFTPTIREGMKSWNITVQYWLASNFHKRLPGPRSVRTMLTMLISAYWHGIHAGYYLAFLTIPLALKAESGLVTLLNLCGRGLPPGTSNFLIWLLKMRVFEYCAMGFLLLDASSTLAYWASIYYLVHIIMVVLSLLDVLCHAVLPASALTPPRTPNRPTVTKGYASAHQR